MLNIHRPPSTDFFYRHKMTNSAMEIILSDHTSPPALTYPAAREGLPQPLQTDAVRQSKSGAGLH